MHGFHEFMPTFSLIFLSQISNYEKEVEDMKHMTRQEFVASIRR